MRPTLRLQGILPKSSYYDNDYRATAALIRARQPYLIKNMITGFCLTGITLGIYAFTFYAVKQDDFSDVPMPDAPTTTTTTKAAPVTGAAVTGAGRAT